MSSAKTEPDTSEDERKVGHVDASSMMAIPVSMLCSTGVLKFDLYLRSTPAAEPLLYRERSVPLKDSDLERLGQRGIEVLYISDSDQDCYFSYLRKEVAGNEELAPLVRHKALRKAARADFEEAFRSDGVDQMVEFTEELGSDMTDILCCPDLVLSDLFALMDHDFYTYTHAMNVCTYSVALAEGLGRYSRDDLAAMATGGLLHDLGKRQIQLDILNKPGRLTDEQRAIINQHPQNGFVGLHKRDDLNWGQLMMVYQHHERIDGKGYPVGLIGEEIHEWARICSVADVFHALTSKRPYRKTSPIEEALGVIKENSGTQFDAEMAECWIKVMTPPD